MIRAAARPKHSAALSSLAARHFPEVQADPCRSGAAGDLANSSPAAPLPPQAPQAPDRGDCRRGLSAAPAELSVPLSGDLLLTLRMAAAAERIAVGEAVRRAISIYADSLGLQVLASALDLDPDLAMQFRQRTGLNRFKGGAP